MSSGSNFSAAAQIMRQADAVKNTMTESGKSFSELWVTRQKLEDLYKRMLLLDLEYALDKKVEQELWNHAFKNQINTLQTQAKDRQNPKKVEAQASLNLFLETASGFYLQFLQMICSTFKLDLPFRRRSAAFGIMRDNTMNYKNIVTPKKSSCLYICCHCLVHLGDIARYRQQTEQAQTYYRHAANLSPNNGQPYNQLAILEASRGDKLSTVFYYVRSLAVRHPFPVAATNLEKFYSKLIKDTRSDFDGPNLTVSEIVTAFLQFQALLHMSTGIDRACNLKTKITTGLGSHIRSQTVSSAHLTGIVAISIFALHRARNDTKDTGEAVRKTVLSSEEERCIQIHLGFAAKLLETMLQHTPKEDNKARDFLTLSAIKVLFDWLYLNKDVLQGRDFNNTSIWLDLCKLLNTLQWLLNDSNKASDLTKYEDTPLPEDSDLRCFQPLEPSYGTFNFNKTMSEELSPACERDLRCQRLVAHGKWVAQDLPKQKLVIYQATKSIRNQFSTQKVPHNTDSHQPPPQKTSQRQNVAMQTIMKKQMQKKMEQELGSTSPLSVISEEGKSTTDQPQRPTSAESNTSQKSGPGGRQAGVITLHHKGGNQKNLPPRLSAKAGAGQGSMLSPRLQKKMSPQSAPASRSNNNFPSGRPSKVEKTEVKEGPAAFSEQEIYPSLSVDNYPALVSQRSNPALIPPESQLQSGSSNFLSGSSWGVLNLGRDNDDGGKGNPMSTVSPMLGVPAAPSSTVDSMSGSSRSPQSSPRMVSPFSNIDQSMRPVDKSMMSPEGDSGLGTAGGGMSFPNSNLSPDFLSAIRSANQFVQQQQQHQNFHPLQQQQMMMGEKPQQFQQNLPYSQQHMNRNLSHQQQQMQKHQQQNQLQSNPRQPHNFYQPPSLGPNVGNFKASPTNPHAPSGNMPARNGNFGAQTGGGLEQNQNPHAPNMNLGMPPQSMNVHPQPGLGGLNMPPPPQRGMQQPSQPMGMDVRPPKTTAAAPNLGYQASRVDSSAQSFIGNQPAPVGFIPPTGVVPPPKGKTSGLGNPNFPPAMLPGTAVGAGRAGNNALHPSSNFMSGQPQRQHLHQQQQSQQPQHGLASVKSQQSGLLYQNIPLPGNATGNNNPAAGSGNSGAGLSALFMSNQGQSTAQNLGQLLGPQQGYNNRGQPSRSTVVQDSRLSASFQGHAAGTPKPEKQGNMAGQFIRQQPPQQPPPPKQAPANQQAMIRAVMDPPFLQASGEYTLFSSNSSPAWPTSLVKTTPSQLMKNPPSKGSSGPSPQMSANPIVPSTIPSDPSAAMQGMWSNTGPSPLERLLEQQRIQRQTDG